MSLKKAELSILTCTCKSQDKLVSQGRSEVWIGYGIVLDSIICILVFCGISNSANLRINKVMDIAPAWSGNPVQFCLVSSNGQQFTAFYDGNKQLTIGKRSLNSDFWQLHKIDEYVTLDAHNYVVFAIDSQGYIHISANMHVVPLKYWRSSRPYDINNFDKIDKMVGKDEQRCTYPIFFTGSQGEFCFKYRDGQSGDGRELINIYDVASKKWKRFIDVPLMDGNSPYGTMNAYQSGPVFGPDGFYHLAWVWRDSPGCETNHTLQYARSKNLLDWETSVSKPIALPITIENGETVDAIGTMGGILNGVRLAFDAQSRPFITYFKFDQDGDTQLYAARCEISGWRIYQVTDWVGRWNFSGGGTIKSQITIGGIHINENGSLLYRFQNRLLTDGQPIECAYVLDGSSLQPVADAQEFFPHEFSHVKSTVPGMRVTYKEDWSQFNKSGKIYVLRWETLDAARDIVKDLDWVPKNQMLQLFEMEMNLEQKMCGSSGKYKDRYKSFKMFFDGLNYSRNCKLSKVKIYVEQGNFVDALKELRKYYLERTNPVLPINPKSHPAISFPIKRLKEADKVLDHEFDYFGTKRVLPYDISTWEPVKSDVLENWTTTMALTLETRPVVFDELEKCSSISKWYNELNTLSYLQVLGKAYFDTRNPRYARKLIHDLGGWSYDNPVPEKPALYGPWYVKIATLRTQNLIDNFCRLLDSCDIDDVEFFRLIHQIKIHRDYLKTCIDLTSGVDKKQTAEALKEVYTAFPEFN